MITGTGVQMASGSLFVRLGRGVRVVAYVEWILPWVFWREMLSSVMVVHEAGGAVGIYQEVNVADDAVHGNRKPTVCPSVAAIVVVIVRVVVEVGGKAAVITTSVAVTVKVTRGIFNVRKDVPCLFR